jgi:hypothetical protein
MRVGEPPLVFDPDREENQIHDKLVEVEERPERVGGKDGPADVNARR